MTQAEEKEEKEEKPVESAAAATTEDRLQKLRQTQITVLTGCIIADLVLLGVGGSLMYKFGIDLSPARLFTTAMIFVSLCGALPAVVLSLLWPSGGEHEQAAIRRTQYGYNVIMACRLLFGALVIGNVILGKYGPRHYDWTSSKVFTLDSVSVKTVQALEKPVKFIALYPRLSEPGRRLETLFEMYNDASRNVSHEFIDRIADKARTDEIYKQFPDSKQADPVVIVTYGSDENPEYKTIRHTEIFPPSTVDARTMGEVKTEFKGEDALTSAITQLTQSKKTNVYFTTGHGELDIEDSDRRSDEGIGIIKERMETQSIQVQAINLTQKEVPKDAGLLVIAGPKMPFFPDEVQKIKDFLAGGGHLIAMIDPGPEMRDEAGTGLESLLAEHNVQIKDNLAIDRAAAYNSPVVLLLPVGEVETSNPVIDDLKDYQVLIDRAREVSSATPPAPPVPGQPPVDTGPYKVETLLSTLAANTLGGMPVSWAETDYRKSREVRFNEGDDTRGPVSLAVAVSRNEGAGPDPHRGMPGAPPPPQKTTPLMVVFGDASFASNFWSSQLPTNRDLFLNSVNWLRGRLELVGIQPKTQTAERLSLSSAQYFRLWFGPGTIMFVGLTVLGVFVWVVRHRF